MNYKVVMVLHLKWYLNSVKYDNNLHIVNSYAISLYNKLAYTTEGRSNI